MVQVVSSYPEYGFAILEDVNGRFVVFKDTDEISVIED